MFLEFCRNWLRLITLCENITLFWSCGPDCIRAQTVYTMMTAPKSSLIRVCTACHCTRCFFNIFQLQNVVEVYNARSTVTMEGIPIFREISERVFHNIINDFGAENIPNPKTTKDNKFPASATNGQKFYSSRNQRIVNLPRISRFQSHDETFIQNFILPKNRFHVCAHRVKYKSYFSSRFSLQHSDIS